MPDMYAPPQAPPVLPVRPDMHTGITRNLHSLFRKQMPTDSPDYYFFPTSQAPVRRLPLHGIVPFPDIDVHRFAADLPTPDTGHETSSHIHHFACIGQSSKLSLIHI